RRPARFTRSEFVETKELSKKQLKSLRTAAARVFIDDKSTEVNTVTAGSTNRKRKAATSVTFDDGVKMLAVAAMIIETKTDKSNN
ncbi:hypothetical protein L195_g050227, partial [Trifolium pratense]